MKPCLRKQWFHKSLRDFLTFSFVIFDIILYLMTTFLPNAQKWCGVKVINENMRLFITFTDSKICTIRKSSLARL